MRGFGARASALAGTVALAACSPAPVPSPRAIAPPLSVASAAPAPPSSAVAVAPVAPPVSLFSPALVSRDWITLHRLSNAVVARREFDGQQFAVAEKDDFVLHPELSQGLPEPGTQYSITSLIGTFPDALWLVARIADRGQPLDRFFDVVYRFKDRRWQAVDRPPADEGYLALWEAPQGCLLGLRGNGRSDGGHFTSKVKIHVVDCKGHTPALPGLLKGPDPGRGRRIYAAAGLPAGELVLVDQEDNPPSKGPPRVEIDPVLLELWARNNASPTTNPLPPPPEVVNATAPLVASDRVLLARAAGEVHVAVNVKDDPHAAKRGATAPGPPSNVPPWIVRFDGAAWTPIERPPVVAYSEIVSTGDGALLLRSNKGPGRSDEAEELWRKRPGEAWTSLGGLPASPPGSTPCLPRQITGLASDDVWVFCWAGSKGGVVHHTRPAAKTVEL